MDLDRTGVFRVKSTEHGLGQTKKAGYPQFNVNVSVLAHYDEDTETWVDYSEYGMETTVRQCLFGVNKKTQKEMTTLSYDNVCKVFKWDGADLQALAETKPGVEFQITVKDNDPDYADKYPYQISWIDDFDADPSQKIAKCTAEEITGLQAKYAQLLKAKAKPAAPAKAPAKTASKKGAKIIEGAKKAAGVVTKTDKPKVPASPPAAPKAPPKAPAAAAPPKSTQVESYTKDQAWQAVVDLKTEDCDDDQLNAAWQSTINIVSEGKGEGVLDGEGWWTVKDKVLDEVGKF